MRKRALLVGVSLGLFSCGCGTTTTTTRSMEVPGAILGGLLGAGSLTLIAVGSHYERLGYWAAGGGALGALVGWYAGHQFSQSQNPDTAP